MFGIVMSCAFILYVIAVVVNVLGIVIGAVFSEAAALLPEALSGEGLAIGFALGMLGWVLYRKSRMTGKKE